MTTETRRPKAGLGRGLASLIPVGEPGAPGVQAVAISRSVANAYQPRPDSPGEELDALTASIAAHGVLQPIVLTESPEGYRLIAGERRLRASMRAGRTTIPAVVRTADEQQQLELALVENLQRSDLNAMDEAV